METLIQTKSDEDYLTITSKKRRKRLECQTIFTVITDHYSSQNSYDGICQQKLWVESWLEWQSTTFWLIRKETQIPTFLLSVSYSKRNTLFWYLKNIFSVKSLRCLKSGQVNFRLMATDSKEKTIFKIKICFYSCISEALWLFNGSFLN